MRHYEYEINLLLDGELEEQEQINIFVHLSECAICREQYVEYLQLKNASKNILNKEITAILASNTKFNPIETLSEFPRKKSTFIYKIGFYTSAAAAILLFFLLINHKPEINYSTGAQVRVDTVFVPREKIVYKEAAQLKTTQNITPESNQRSYLKYLATLPQKQVKLVPFQAKL